LLLWPVLEKNGNRFTPYYTFLIQKNNPQLAF
jgi:hypothetical protein